MGFAGLRSKETALHPAVAAVGPMTIVDRLPVAAGFLTTEGQTVYRNEAAAEMLRGLSTQHGAEGGVRLRDMIFEVCRRSTSYPRVEVVTLTTGENTSKVELNFDQLPGGWVVNWRDVTADQKRIEMLSETADELADASDAFGKISSELADDATSVANRADTVSAGATELSASIQSIAESASAAASDTATAVDAADGAKERIGKLVESSAQVEAVSKLINSIAEQTNLLALNATIEAARAGAAGKGFAVVAGEVKELASRTSEATERITTTIQAIQSDSEMVASSISRIVDVIGEIESKQTTIAGAVEQQSATAAEMSENVSGVAVSTQSTAQLVVDLREVAARVQSKSQELHELI